jgi:transcriptional regulator NrdR family protein
MVRGTVITHRRRCGKPNCRCATGESLHEAAVLSYSQDGRTKFVMLQASEVESVRAATERFRVAKSQLEAEANAGLAELVARPRRRVKTS